MTEPHKVVVVGGSWGSLGPVHSLLLGLRPVADHLTVVVVIHRGTAGGEGVLEQILVRGTGWPVAQVEDKTALTAGRVHVAPADYHLLVEPGQLTLSTEAPVNHSRPSLDVTFTSAAEAYGPAVVAVVLSGANADGAAGAADIAHAGGTVLVQDPATAESPRMPKAAIAAGVAHLVAPVEELATWLVAVVGGAS